MIKGNFKGNFKGKLGGYKEPSKGMNELFAYYNFVSDQREGFVRIMLHINKLINQLKDNGNISEYVELRARIKAPMSAIRNDRKKTLDDVFGMEVLTATESEIEIVKNEIEKYMIANEERCNKWDKPNGYKAEHRMLTLRKDKTEQLGLENEEYENIPEIEFQFKTFEVAINAAIGNASHSKYKNVNQAEIQERYDKNGFSKNQIPIMWVSDHGRMRALSNEEVLKKMYPFLDTRKNKDRDKDEGEER